MILPPFHTKAPPTESLIFMHVSLGKIFSLDKDTFAAGAGFQLNSPNGKFTRKRDEENLDEEGRRGVNGAEGKSETFSLK